jgi:exodeoxyribonuclease V gamma subunit
LSLNDWLGLFQVQAVRERFGLNASDVSQLHNWLDEAGVRWGLDAQHRQAWGMSSDLPDASQNTWGFGLQRLLLGYAQGGQSEVPPIWHNTLGQAGIDGLDAPVISGLLRYLQAITHSLEALSQMHSPTEWVQQLQTLVERFFKATDDNTQRLLERVLAPLEDWLNDCQSAQFDAPLALSVVRLHWLAQMDAPSLQRRFMGGGVQFATLMPMRAIPFKVVCLLGMNDKDYPRQTLPRDFDLMALQWRAGDRSRREDDRYLFLEALLSARDKLYISWQSHRATDNAEQPPSVLVSQLMDVLRARFANAPAPVLQPLQAFSSRYFEVGSDFSTYAADWQLAMGLALNEAAEPAKLLETETSAAPKLLEKVLDMTALQAFLRSPVQVYWRHRLAVQIDQPEAAAPEDEPFDLDGLAQFKLGQNLVQALSADEALQSLQGQGELPMAAFGRKLGHDVLYKANAVRERAAAWLVQYPDVLPTQALDSVVDDWTLTGAVPDLRQGPDGCLQLSLQPGAVTHGKDHALPRWDKWINLWVVHVLACACGHPLRSVLLGIDGETTMPVFSPAQAKAQLRLWLQAYATAWQAPLPVALRTGLAFLAVLNAEKSEKSGSEPDSSQADKEFDASMDERALAHARDAFDGGYAAEGEWRRSPYLQRSFESFDDIAQSLPQWADALYGGLFKQVQLTQAQRGEKALTPDPGSCV